jgi:acetyltransferase-like isoleucine patch superfamily enzyme
LFGASVDGIEMLGKLKPFIWLEQINIVGFLDNEAGLCGSEFMGYTVTNPADVLELEFDWIIITPIFHQMICEQLLELGVAEEAIKTQYSLPFPAAEEHEMMFNVKMGRHSYHKGHSLLRNCDIGSFTCIGDYVTIGVSSHILDNVAIYPLHIRLLREFSTDKSASVSRRTEIGSDVYIGEHATVFQGLSIGHGAVLATRSVVTKDVPPYAVVGGVPAKIIKYRFPPDIIEKLLEIAWWEWSDEKIQEHVDLFYKSTEDFVEYFT